MRIEYEGQSYEFEMSDITVKQAIKIEKHLGCPIAEFGDRLQSSDMAAIQCLGWLILHGGHSVAIDDTDFSVMKLMQAFSAALTAGQEQAAAGETAGPVPTVAVPASNGQTPDAVPVTVP